MGSGVGAGINLLLAPRYDVVKTLSIIAATHTRVILCIDSYFHSHTLAKS